jgi:riboflavin kinase/FMN adenylyltransferase
MLEVVKYGEGEYSFPCLLVLGCFDAIHLGHVEILKKAKLQAKINGLDLGVMMFESGKGGRQVASFDERLAILEGYGVKFVLSIDYTDEFKAITYSQFLETLDNQLNVKGYMSGKDFRFGAGAKGKSSTLKNYADDEENGVWYMSVKDVMYEDVKISTTLIKSLLESGDIAKANAMLGRPYSVCGEVVTGAGRGTTETGFPTVNIDYPEEKVQIKQGVYAVKCTVGDTEYVGIANYGARPTFDDETPVLEAYLDGFSGSLYGEKLEIKFTEYLRDIVKFESVDKLKEQLEEDIKRVRG